MENEEEINGLGYEEFLGREILENGHECFVNLNLKFHGSISWSSFGYSCDRLCSLIKKGRRVLLYQSPGRIGSRIKRSDMLREEIETVLGRVMDGKDSSAVVVDSNQGGKVYTIMGRRYVPFEPKEMLRLRRMYSDRPEMKEFPNPFNDQPLI